MDLRPCDLCNGKTFLVLRRPKNSQTGLNRFSSSSNVPLMSQLVKCKDCGLVFVNPRLHQEALSQAYGNVVDETHAAEPDLRIRSFRRAMTRVIKKVPELAPSGGLKLVDIGCAGGEFPQAAAGMGYQVVGYEPSIHLSTIARNRYGLDIRTGLFDPDHFRNRDVDLVTMWDVLEHVDEPSEMFASLVGVLKADGFLLLNVPMIDTFSAQVLRRFWPFYLEVHLYYFTRQTLNEYLGRYGFRVLYETSYSQTLGSRYLVRRATSARIVNFWPDLPIRYKLGQRTIVARRIAGE